MQIDVKSKLAMVGAIALGYIAYGWIYYATLPIEAASDVIQLFAALGISFFILAAGFTYYFPSLSWRFCFLLNIFPVLHSMTKLVEDRTEGVGAIIVTIALAFITIIFSIIGSALSSKYIQVLNNKHFKITKVNCIEIAAGWLEISIATLSTFYLFSHISEIDLLQLETIVFMVVIAICFVGGVSMLKNIKMRWIFQLIALPVAAIVIFVAITFFLPAYAQKDPFPDSDLPVS